MAYKYKDRAQEYFRLQARKVREEKKLRNECLTTGCSKKRAKNRSSCKACLKKNIINQRKRRAELKKLGKCIEGGCSNVAIKGRVRCAKCTKKHSIAGKIKRKAKLKLAN